MRNIRFISLYLTLAIILTLNLRQWGQWEITVPRINLDGSPVPDSGRDMLNTFLKNPFALILSPGWGDKGQQVFQIILLSLILVAVLWVLQGGRTRTVNTDSIYSISHHEWWNHLYSMKPIDCRFQTLIWILVTVPLALIFVSTGATLNYFWDFTHNIPYYPWHWGAHFLFAYSIMSVWACFDIEETFKCRYRWKAFTLMGAINAFSLYLENTENLMIIQSGLHEWMFNNLPDSTFDMVAVILGGVIALTCYNAVQYSE